MMLNSPRWVGLPILTPVGVVTNACRPTYLMRKGHGAETRSPWQLSGELCARRALTRLWYRLGGIHSFDQAEALLAEDKADIVGFARQSLADPDWFEKVRLGRGDEVMLCRYSNYCEGLDQKHKQVTCELWDRNELDAPDTVLATDGKRRLTAPRWVPEVVE